MSSNGISKPFNDFGASGLHEKPEPTVGMYQERRKAKLLGGARERLAGVIYNAGPLTYQKDEQGKESFTLQNPFPSPFDIEVVSVGPNVIALTLSNQTQLEEWQRMQSIERKLQTYQIEFGSGNVTHVQERLYLDTFHEREDVLKGQPFPINKHSDQSEWKILHAARVLGLKFKEFYLNEANPLQARERALETFMTLNSAVDTHFTGRKPAATIVPIENAAEMAVGFHIENHRRTPPPTRALVVRQTRTGIVRLDFGHNNMLLVNPSNGAVDITHYTPGPDTDPSFPALLDLNDEGKFTYAKMQIRRVLQAYRNFITSKAPYGATDENVSFVQSVIPALVLAA